MSTTSPQPQIATPRKPRRWLRFSLRLLIIGVTLLCIGLGWWTHRARQQRRIVERIERSGGQVSYEYDVEDGYYFPAPRLESPLPRVLITLFGHDFFHQVKAVEISDDLDVIAELPSLSAVDEIHIGNDAVTDEHLEPLRQVRTLKDVVIVGTPGSPRGASIGDSTLALLGELPLLEGVWVKGCGRFTDAGLAALANAPSLSYVEVSGCHKDLNTEAAAEMLERVRPTVVFSLLKDRPLE